MKDEEKQKNYELAEKLISEQNFAAAVIAGAVATLLAAAAYGIIVATWRLSYGFAAVGIGIVVGLSMQYLGRGIATKFAVVAVVYTLAGYLLGNVFTIIVRQAVSRGTSPIDVLRDSSLPALADESISTFALIDLVYLFVAVFCAAFLANRSLSRSERLAIGMVRLKD